MYEIIGIHSIRNKFLLLRMNEEWIKLILLSGYDSIWQLAPSRTRDHSLNWTGDK